MSSIRETMMYRTRNTIDQLVRVTQARAGTLMG
jgi:hypothetical protein